MSKPTQEQALPCPFDCDGTAQYFEDDYNHGYLCEKCEGCFMPCLKPLRIQSGPAPQHNYKCGRCKDTGRWGWDENPHAYECDHKQIEAPKPWGQSGPAMPVDVEDLKDAVWLHFFGEGGDTMNCSQGALSGIIDHLAAQGHLRQPLPEIEGDISNIAKAILKNVVGLTFNSDTASITMTPESFMRCIREAARAYAERSKGGA